MTPSPSSLSRSIRALSLGFLCVFGLFGMTSCGGGPDVSTSTGTTLYVGSTNGIYAFSLQSNNVLKPVSSTPLASGTVYSLQYVQSPGGSGTPTLYAATGATSITTYTITGGGALSASGPLSPSSCLGSYTGVTATPDGNWLLAVDGTTSSSNNIAAINLKTKTCYPAGIGTYYPISVSVDCQIGASACNFFLTLSTSSISAPVPGTNPEYFSGWNTTSTSTTFPGTPSTLTRITPLYSAFSPSTSYFYFSTNSASSGQLGSVLGGNSVTTTTTYASSTTIPSTITSPCVDQKDNQIYLPTPNGAIYQISINTSGGMGSPNQIWTTNASTSLQPPPSYISACTIKN